MPYRTIDLCAGIGGIRRGFEMTGRFENVLSSEIDKYACETYRHLYEDDPENDITDEKFKALIDQTPYEILLAGFPCQTFSRAGLQQGFENDEKGIIFLHIVDIIERTRPRAFFLENVDHLTSHNKGETLKEIIEELEDGLNYHIVGVSRAKDGSLIYKPRDFICNSRFFGVPQNRPRTYLVGFDRVLFPNIDELPLELPKSSDLVVFNNLVDILDHPVDPKYYLSQGYYDTLITHRERNYREGNRFGFKIINAPEIETPVANTLLATGGSGKERNLVIDDLDGIPGTVLEKKRTPLNDECVRNLTPTEWGRLQGFIGYAFIEDGEDCFSFPDGITDNQKYKQLGNSVTIPVIRCLAEYMLNCLGQLNDEEPEYI